MFMRSLLLVLTCVACDKNAPSSSSELGTPSENAIRVRAVEPGYWKNVAGAEVWVFEIASGRDAKVQLSFGAPNQKVLHERLGKHAVTTSTDEVTTAAFTVKRGVPFVAYARLHHVSNLAHCFSNEPRPAGNVTESFHCTELEVGMVGPRGSMTAARRTIYRFNSQAQRGASWRAAPVTGWTDRVVKDRVILAKSVMAPEEEGLPEIDASPDEFRVTTGGKPVDLATWTGLADRLALTFVP